MGSNVSFKIAVTNGCQSSLVVFTNEKIIHVRERCRYRILFYNRLTSGEGHNWMTHSAKSHFLKQLFLCNGFDQSSKVSSFLFLT
ncbi:hypothetical protein SAMN06296020_101137 [Anoxynatronum buryatiense]|uniref:Uncharacterized protein n=1 Tax=Anoxynatronum buryatiense TaxID=489973 RepID=A0AA45WSM9_9CLOT|nr:hypothetical protein SAMN06296020_101137 [Anoxynatronum buryatiense]